jgi:hypothetical protein
MLLPDHFLQVLGIAGTLHINLRNRPFDIAQIVGRQLDARAADIINRYSVNGIPVGWLAR